MSNNNDISRLQVMLDEYKAVIDTQMHFNDMLMKMRTTVLSVVIAVFGGAAAVLGQYPDKFININNFYFHIATPVIFFGLMLLLAIFLIDYFYYYKMLLGAVKRGYEFDKFFKDKDFYQGFHIFGMSEKIRDSIGQVGRSKYLVIWFYAIIGLSGLAYLAILLVFIKPNL